MKFTYKSKILQALMMLTLLSCSNDFLDLEPIGSVNSESFFKTQTDALQALNGSYSSMRGLVSTIVLLGEVRSDNSVAHYDPGNRASGNPEREELDEFRDLASNPNVQDFWSRSYNGVFNTNTLLSRIDAIPMDATLKARIIAEAKFIRAFTYFNLVRVFGDVPLITTPIADLSAAYAIGRSRATEVYDQIIADAQAAAAVLPVSYDNLVNNEFGRITKGAALTLLGKVFLTVKPTRYDEAQAALDQVTTLGYVLQTDFANCFKVKNNSEAIFELQYSTAVSQAFNAANSWVPRGAGTGSPWDIITGGKAGNVTTAWNIPSKDFMEAFEPDDKRRDVTYGIALNAVVGAVPTRQDIQYVNKWIRYGGDCNFQVYRYSDVLLMLAEIHAQKGDGLAAGFLNQVRNHPRTALPPTTATTKNELLLAIEQERRIELAFEGHRWFDLVRTDRAKSVMTAYGLKERADPSVYRDVPYSSTSFNIQDFRLLYPIPLAEILKNTSVLGQNAGY